ncbi:MAG: (5-formylfuran-3-yl)methyl phosphate synthase [Promethearchaeota archaeon]|nr:MAG: (5-formylfuran-3-yl)methyl phosphate synthase [Candidatus Lokiarchaeota archaeon]
MQNTIKLLVSPQNLEEAQITIKAGSDYIDCKNPKEGSLGANFPWIIKKMKELIPKENNQLLSAAIGDFPYLPGTASLAALGAVTSGADIIKVGLMGPKNEQEALDLMKPVVKTVKTYNKSALVVVAGYADYSRMEGSPEFLSIPSIGAKSGADIVMLDTYIKDDKNLFDFLTIEQLKEFNSKAKRMDLQVALAGRLKFEDIDNIKKIGPNIIGVRSAVCKGFDRNKGKMDPHLIKSLKEKLLAYE